MPPHNKTIFQIMAEMDNSIPDNSNYIPTVNERLGHLRPSRELLEFYRRKIAEFDNEYESLLKRLHKYKCTYEEQHKSQWEIRQREDEISELQKALSDMQVFLFQEREHVLRLYAENDRLRIQELDDRKKIQHLLTLTQPVNAETTYFIKEPPAKVLVQQHIPRAMAGGETFALSGRGPGGHKKPQSQNKTVENQQDDDDNVDKETLLLTVEALRAQLEEQTRLCKEQVETLLEDRRVKAEEADVQHQRDSDRVKSLADKLQNTQELLYESTKDYLELKYELRAKERSWMKEKDKLLQQLDHYKQQLDISAGIDPVLGMNFSSSPSDRTNANKGNLCYLKDQLQQTQQLADNYREQCIKLEEEVGRLREESDASKDLFKQRTEKATKRLGLMNTRYQNLEKRRAMEIEGYKNDIKMLRSRLKDVEKQLYKLTMGLSGDQDEEVLRAVRRTASNSKKLVGDLQTLKARVYSLENDTRHVHDL